MPQLDLSCPDWEARLREGRSLVPDLPLDLVEANRAAAVFDKLRLADVPGTPAMADAGGEWFRAIIRALFGSVDPLTRERRIRELFLLVPKKNNKTTGGALLMLTALLLNRRPLAPFFFVAPVHDVAEVAFAATAGAIALDEVLSKKLHVREHLKAIVHRETGATLEVMTFDPAVLTGQKCAGALIDELHVVAKMAKAASAIRQLRGGMLPFPEAFMAFITTQSEEAPTGAFRAELTKARMIRDGKRRGAMLPVLYEFPREIQTDKNKAWKNPALWPMVTPNNGRSITVARLEQEFDSAQSVGEEEARAWASQHLNVEVGLALHSDRWAGADYWEGQAEPEKVGLQDLLRRCEVVELGIDGGGLDDLLGMAAVGREADGTWLCWTHAWAHPSVLERHKADEEVYRGFAEDGDLTLVEKIGEDVAAVAALARRCEDSGLLDKVGIDPHGVGGILDALETAGVPKEKIIGISQGWKMTGSIKTVERKLAGGAMTHGGQRLMAWCVGNAKAEPRGNATIITKQASGTAKIDPLMAVFNAASLLLLNPPAQSASTDWLKAPVLV